ncbi:unnamed protein product [Malassezia sympodialis ATCC 42132]|uniref:Uncharacterized protein n=1 Tax=Malassezia sympodialis (strain ATCC 42132) TaxID=1230383 RepID=M5E4J1_MALS4|nr:uncharacterized protein MSY001_0296 [Malassezia sympodialis ATCC 42132]CCU97590.1 unnamed protein product [Malassezia sympodialis ATCC 42132]SHO76983.1 Uncharacterized protein MSYG_1322 [Malassezia sympodialis ATCC 42132]|eukprot:XP_018738938.1 uncharacterized protein MSY001_0296 [Malassezia sympodialis ATCC 42132]
MDDGLVPNGAPPPRHELESDDEDALIEAVHPIRLVGSVPHGRAWSVLLDDTGAAVLLATQGDWTEQAHFEAGPTKLAGIHVPASESMPIMLFVPASLAVPLPLQQKMAQAVAQCRPRSVAVLQPYAPNMVLCLPDMPRGDTLNPPVQYLLHTPPTQSPPPAWATVALQSCQPWSAPNTLTGCGAALFAQAMYLGCPALLLSVPSTRPHAHPHYHTASQPNPPRQDKVRAPSDVREQLARLVEPLDGHYEALLLKMVGNGAAEGTGPSLLVDAWQAAMAAHTTAGHIGDGGMYI